MSDPSSMIDPAALVPAEVITATDRPAIDASVALSTDAAVHASPTSKSLRTLHNTSTADALLDLIVEQLVASALDPFKDQVQNIVEPDESEESDSTSDESSDESSICQSEMELSDHELEKEEIVLKTKNEIPELPPVERIHVEIPIEEPLICVGRVDQIIQDNLVIVSADNSGDYQVLDMDSILLTRDKKPIGKIFEVFGRVEKPLYSIRISGKEEIQELGLEINAPVYYIQNLVQMVFTQPLKAQKGSDASNLHDEEIGENEAEFSDDEKEQEFKKLLKKRKNQSNDSFRKSSKADNSNHKLSSNQKLNSNNQRYNYQQQPQSFQQPHSFQQNGFPNTYDQYTQYYYQMMQASFNQYHGQVYNYQANQYPYGYAQGAYYPAYQMGSQNLNNANQGNSLTIQHIPGNQVANEEKGEEGEVSLYENIFQQ